MELMQLFTGAILLEALVDASQRIVTKTIQWEYILALILGVAVAVIYGLDVFDLAGLVTEVPYVGAVFTGVILARGSNYLYEILKRLGIGSSLKRPG